MVDRRFFHVRKPLTLPEMSKISGAALVRGSSADVFSSVSALEDATPEDLSMLHNSRYREILRKTQAGAVIVSPGDVNDVPVSISVLATPQPLKAFALILDALYGEETSDDSLIHPHAVIHPTAHLKAGCRVGAGAVIGARVHIGENSWIGAQSVIGESVQIGSHCRIGPQVTISHAILGSHVKVKPGASIGQSGFGFFMGEGSEAHVTQLQLGRVLMGDYVEVGSHTTIDRGSLKDTVIEDFVRIDNSVQVAHNVHLGRGVVLVSQVGIAGSTSIGAGSVLGGQVGVAGHLTIGSGVRVAAKSGVTRDIPSGETWGGMPAVPIQRWRRQVGTLSRLASLKKSQSVEPSQGSKA